MKILALDFGTSNFKAYLIDEKGITLKKIREPNLGLEKITQTIKEMSTIKVDAITVTGQSFIPICIDDTGKIITPIISYLDYRSSIAYDILQKVIKEPGYAVTKLVSGLMWMKEGSKANMDKIKMVMDVKEYIGYLLTGQSTYDQFELNKTDIKVACDTLGLRKEIFGVPHNYDEPIGTAAENRAPVYIMPSDTRTALIGSGILSVERSMADIAGTTEVLGIKVKGDSSLEPIKPIIFNLPIYFSSPPYGALIEWAKSISKKMLNFSSGKGGFIVPRFSREKQRWDVRFDIYGYSQFDSGNNFMESTYEAVAAEIALFTRSIENAGEEIDKIIVSGGGSLNSKLNQLKADITRKAVISSGVIDTTILGSAIIAFVNLGMYGDLTEASDAMFSMSKEYTPKSNYEKYLRKYAMLKARYKKRPELL